MDETHPEIVSSITETGLLTDDNRIALDAALNEFIPTFLAAK